MQQTHFSKILIFFSLPFFLFFQACSLPDLSSDIETFVEMGLSIIMLDDQTIDYVSSSATTEISLDMINPSDLEATYTVTVSDEDSSLVSSISSDDSLVESDNILTVELTTSADAEHEEIELLIDITASTGRIYDTDYIWVPCDTSPNAAIDVDADFGDDLKSCVTFSLPTESTDDDLIDIEVTYGLESCSTNTTDTFDVGDATYYDSSSDTYTYTPSEAEIGDNYIYSIIIIDSVGQSSSSEISSNSDLDYYTITYHNSDNVNDDDYEQYVLADTEATVSSISTTGFSSDSGYTFAGYTLSDSDDDYTTVYYDVDDDSDDAMTIASIDSDMDLYTLWVDGTPIRTATELEYLNTMDSTYGFGDWDADYFLTCDIDLSSVYTHSPIGSSSENFSGTFNGLYHTLNNLSMTSYSSNYGLFGYINGGTIQDLSLNDSSLTDTSGYETIGILAGYIEDGTIENCSIFGTSTIISDGNIGVIGILAGHIEGGTIEDCSIYGTSSIESYGSDIGILAGYIDGGTVENCSISDTSTIVGYGNEIGILAGYINGGTVENCSISGESTIDSYGSDIGILAGYIDGGTVESCSISGISSIDGNGSEIGILAGYIGDGTIESCSISGASTIESDGSEIGILAGYINGGTVENCSISDTSTIESDGSDIGILAGYINGGTVENCSISGISSIDGNGSYIGILAGYINSGTVDTCAISGTSTITGEGDYIGGITGEAQNCTFTDNTVEDLAITGGTENQYVGGFAGYMNGCTVSISDGTTSIDTVSISYTDENTGGMVGQAENTTINNFDIDDVLITNPARSYNGGLIGYASSCDVDNCDINTITIDSPTGESDNNGGLIGYTGSSNISNCNVTEVSIIAPTKTHHGGLIGQAYTGTTISECTVETVTISSAGSDTENSYCGGLIGEASCETISDCSVTDVKIVSPIGDYNGGLIGSVDSLTSLSDCTVDSVTISSPGGNSNGGLIGYADLCLLISGCQVADVSITSTESYFNGGFIGYLTLTTGTDISITESSVDEGSISGDQAVGGFIGYLMGDYYESSSTLAIDQCYANIDLTGITDAGGFIGDIDSLAPQTTVTDCYYRGIIDSGTSDYSATCAMIGSSVPDTSNGTSGDSNNISFTNCFVSAVDENGNYLGFLGTYDSSLSIIIVDVSYCYYETSDGSDISDCHGSSLISTELTDSTNGDGYFDNWDTSTIWSLSSDDNDDYPDLIFDN